jgi:hypothetical protein
MSEQLLGLLRIGLLVLLYLFFARVLWAVWSEVRAPVMAGGRTAPRSRSGRSGAGGSVNKLVIVEPAARRGGTIPLDPGTPPATLGRADDCTLVLGDDTFVSSRHARIWHDGEHAVIEDLGSTNGTYVNGKRIAAPHALRPRDVVSVGSFVMEAR